MQHAPNPPPQATVHLRSYRPLPCPMTAAWPSPSVYSTHGPTGRISPWAWELEETNVCCTLHQQYSNKCKYLGRKQERACAARLSALIASPVRHHAVPVCAVHGFAIWIFPFQSFYRFVGRGGFGLWYGISDEDEMIFSTQHYWFEKQWKYRSAAFRSTIEGTNKHFGPCPTRSEIISGAVTAVGRQSRKANSRACTLGERRRKAAPNEDHPVCGIHTKKVRAHEHATPRPWQRNVSYCLSSIS